MSEPMVEIPARVALIAGKHFYHLAKIHQDHRDLLNELSDDLLSAVNEQCSESDLNESLISAKIQESNLPQSNKTGN